MNRNFVLNLAALAVVSSCAQAAQAQEESSTPACQPLQAQIQAAMDAIADKIRPPAMVRIGFDAGKSALSNISVMHESTDVQRWIRHGLRSVGCSSDGSPGTRYYTVVEFTE